MRLAAILIAAVATAAVAPSPITRTQLQRLDFPPDRYASILMKGVIVPHGLVARHTHPGVEIGYVEAGQALLSVEGQPDRRLARGDSFSIPPRTPHSLRNLTAGPLIVLSTYVVERGQPLSTPAPAR
jgi:quercetin dioxygenase-like cupin family protein